MTIVSVEPEPAPTLQVSVLRARDADAAASGEADELLVLSAPEDGGRTPSLAVVSAVARETDLPVRVLIRDGHGLQAEDGDLERAAEFALACRELGATGFSFGFLDRDLEIDANACAALAATLGGAGWTFHRGFDAALAPDRAWRVAASLPGLEAVASAGSTRGLGAGGEELLRRASADPGIATLIQAAGDLDAALVPWLVRAGVRRFALESEARADRSWSKADVDAALVRSWRLLLDDAHQRALGISAD